MSTRTAEFVRFVVERHHVSLRKDAGAPWPWTKDKILQTYRFCNVYRERDKVTRWIRQNWSFPGKGDVWFAMAVARLINWPDTLQHLRPLPWNPDHFRKVMDTRMAAGVQSFGPAYIVSTNGKSMPKPLYLADYVLQPLWEARAQARPHAGDTLASFHERLTGFQGLGSFMAAQVVADTKNTSGGGLAPGSTRDWMTWAAPGPGSMRGLNRLLGNGAKKNGLRPDVFLEHLGELRHAVNVVFLQLGWTAVCAQDVQNCLCEFDKYERVRLGEGRPKQGYQR